MKEEIPRRFHRIWLGKAEMRRECEAFWWQLKVMHPDWEFFTWCDLNASMLVRENPHIQRIYRIANSPATKSDILRTVILAKHGGVYVDVDIQPLRPIDELLQGKQCVLAQCRRTDMPSTNMSHFGLHNCIAAAIPHHAFFETLVRMLPGWFLNHQFTNPIISTGTGFWERVLGYDSTNRTKPKFQANIYLAKPEELVPFNYNEPIDVEAAKQAGAYTIHHSHFSWNNQQIV